MEVRGGRDVLLCILSSEKSVTSCLQQSIYKTIQPHSIFHKCNNLKHIVCKPTATHLLGLRYAQLICLVCFFNLTAEWGCASNNPYTKLFHVHKCNHLKNIPLHCDEHVNIIVLLIVGGSGGGGAEHIQ